MAGTRSELAARATCTGWASDFRGMRGRHVETPSIYVRGHSRTGQSSLRPKRRPLLVSRRQLATRFRPRMSTRTQTNSSIGAHARCSGAAHREGHEWPVRIEAVVRREVGRTAPDVGDSPGAARRADHRGGGVRRPGRGRAGRAAAGPVAAAAVGVLLAARLACANLDGGVARDSGRSTRFGAVVNELGDRLAEFAALAGRWRWRHRRWSGWPRSGPPRRHGCRWPAPRPAHPASRADRGKGRTLPDSGCDRGERWAVPLLLILAAGSVLTAAVRLRRVHSHCGGSHDHSV